MTEVSTPANPDLRRRSGRTIAPSSRPSSRPTSPRSSARCGPRSPAGGGRHAGHVHDLYRGGAPLRGVVQRVDVALRHPVQENRQGGVARASASLFGFASRIWGSLLIVQPSSATHTLHLTKMRHRLIGGGVSPFVVNLTVPPRGTICQLTVQAGWSRFPTLRSCLGFRVSTCHRVAPTSAPASTVPSRRPRTSSCRRMTGNT